MFREVRTAIRAHGCRRAILVGHNAAFDLGFLNAAVERTGIKRNPFHPFSCFDTATLGGGRARTDSVGARLHCGRISTGIMSRRTRQSTTRSAHADLFCHVCNAMHEQFLRADERARALGWKGWRSGAAGSGRVRAVKPDPWDQEGFRGSRFVQQLLEFATAAASALQCRSRRSISPLTYNWG